jgi:N-dimethylarginine dimethylaminohydrolase
MGKPARMASRPRRARVRRGRPRWTTIAGTIEPPGRIEGGDVVWFDDRTVAVGRGYRTNAEGIRQFASLSGRRSR